MKNNVILAPMAGVTDLVFRTLARDAGCSLCFTEMVSAKGLEKNMAKTYGYLRTASGDKPLGVQIFGFEPLVLAEAARIVSDMGAHLVDINMGCPVKKVVKTGAGAALMKDPRRIAEIICRVRRATGLPLTVKIRSGWNRDTINAVEVARIAEDSGVDGLVIHPRTANQGFSGLADWELIGKIRGNVSIPLVGSGDIKNPRDARRMIQSTGCDAVMVGRAAFGNPWIFKGINACLAGSERDHNPSLLEREEMIIRHMDMNSEFYGDVSGIKVSRKHLLWYTKGLKNGAQFRRNAMGLTDRKELVAELERYFLKLAGTDSDN